jgi:hypothetical protein
MIDPRLIPHTNCNSKTLTHFREVGLRHATELRILLSGFGGACAPEQLTPEARELVKAWARGWAKGFGLDESTAGEIFAEVDTLETESCEAKPADL